MSRYTGNEFTDRKSEVVLQSLFDIKKDLKQSKDIMDVYHKKVMEWECRDMKQLGISDHYMILDSYQKLEDSHPDRGEYKFHFNPRGATKDQAIGIRDDITRIIEMTVSKFTIPLTSLVSFDTNVIDAIDPSLSVLNLTQNTAVPTADISIMTDRAQQYAHRRITMYMRDISAQSFIDNEDAHHHFEFETTGHGHGSSTIPGHTNSNSILLTPIDDNYVFTDPINHVHGMVVNFFNPDYALKMPPDVIYGVSFYAMDTTSFSSTNIIEIRFNEPTGQLTLLVGDRIFFKGFENYYDEKITQNHTLNRYINRPEGHIIGLDPISTSTVGGIVLSTNNTYKLYLNPIIQTISLDGPTGSGSTYSDGDEIKSKTRVNMYIAKNRIRIPIRFRTLTKKYTNGIVAI